MGAQKQRGAYSRVYGASTAFRPVAVGVGGAERGAPMSQSAYRRGCGAATPKGAAQRGCSATGPTPRATGAPAALGYAGAGPTHPSTTMLTSLFSTYTTFLIAFPLIHSPTFASVFDAAITCSLLQSAGTVTLLRNLPLTCIGIVSTSSWRRAASKTGQRSWARPFAWPVAAQSSTAT